MGGGVHDYPTYCTHVLGGFKFKHGHNVDRCFTWTLFSELWEKVKFLAT